MTRITDKWSSNQSKSWANGDQITQRDQIAL